jgi:hypothetical protein
MDEMELAAQKLDEIKVKMTKYFNLSILYL